MIAKPLLGAGPHQIHRNCHLLGVVGRLGNRRGIAVLLATIVVTGTTHHQQGQGAPHYLLHAASLIHKATTGQSAAIMAITTQTVSRDPHKWWILNPSFTKLTCYHRFARSLPRECSREFFALPGAAAADHRPVTHEYLLPGYGRTVPVCQQGLRPGGRTTAAKRPRRQDGRRDALGRSVP
ncbi:hypothetical protein D3C84_862650 [compost metagenome]